MTHTDIKTQGWISSFPQRWQPYAILMRLDRPIGWWLLFLPAAWGIILGANGAQGMVLSDVRLLILFLIGAIIMRGAGCIVNDIWDRDLDKQVERTKDRPLASGQIGLVSACAFLAYLLFAGFIILLMTSGITILLGVLSLVLVGVYPFMKRITWWPQAFLGITFNFGALMGWSAAVHELRLEAFVLYSAAFFWTLGYDTIYAHQDKDDDEMVGIKSTALLFGSRSKGWVGLFYFLSLVLLIVACVIGKVGLVTYALLIFPAIHLFRQISEWDIYDPENSLAVFKSNRNYGLMVAFALLFSQMLNRFIPWIEAKTGIDIPAIPHIDLIGAVQQLLA